MNNQEFMPEIRGVGRAYLITMSLLFGAFLLYAVFALPPESLPGTLGLEVVPIFVFVLLFFPFLVLGLGLYGVIGFWNSADFLLSFVSLLAVLAFYLMWWGIWQVLYGKPRKLTTQIP